VTLKQLHCELSTSSLFMSTDPTVTAVKDVDCNPSSVCKTTVTSEWLETSQSGIDNQYSSQLRNKIGTVLRPSRISASLKDVRTNSRLGEDCAVKIKTAGASFLNTEPLLHNDAADGDTLQSRAADDGERCDSDVALFVYSEASTSSVAECLASESAKAFSQTDTSQTDDVIKTSDLIDNAAVTSPGLSVDELYNDSHNCMPVCTADVVHHASTSEVVIVNQTETDHGLGGGKPGKTSESLDVHTDSESKTDNSLIRAVHVHSTSSHINIECLNSAVSQQTGVAAAEAVSMETGKQSAGSDEEDDILENVSPVNDEKSSEVGKHCVVSAVQECELEPGRTEEMHAEDLKCGRNMDQPYPYDGEEKHNGKNNVHERFFTDKTFEDCRGPMSSGEQRHVTSTVCKPAVDVVHFQHGVEDFQPIPCISDTMDAISSPVVYEDSCSFVRETCEGISEKMPDDACELLAIEQQSDMADVNGNSVIRSAPVGGNSGYNGCSILAGICVESVDKIPDVNCVSDLSTVLLDCLVDGELNVVVAVQLENELANHTERDVEKEIGTRAGLPEKTADVNSVLDPSPDLLDCPEYTEQNVVGAAQWEKESENQTGMDVENETGTCAELLEKTLDDNCVPDQSPDMLDCPDGRESSLVGAAQLEKESENQTGIDVEKENETVTCAGLPEKTPDDHCVPDPSPVLLYCPDDRESNVVGAAQPEKESENQTGKNMENESGIGAGLLEKTPDVNNALDPSLDLLDLSDSGKSNVLSAAQLEKETENQATEDVENETGVILEQQSGMEVLASVCESLVNVTFCTLRHDRHYYHTPQTCEEYVDSRENGEGLPQSSPDNDDIDSDDQARNMDFVLAESTEPAAETADNDDDADEYASGSDISSELHKFDDVETDTDCTATLSSSSTQYNSDEEGSEADDQSTDDDAGRSHDSDCEIPTGHSDDDVMVFNDAQKFCGRNSQHQGDDRFERFSTLRIIDICEDTNVHCAINSTGPTTEHIEPHQTDDSFATVPDNVNSDWFETSKHIHKEFASQTVDHRSKPCVSNRQNITLRIAEDSSSEFWWHGGVPKDRWLEKNTEELQVPNDSDDVGSAQVAAAAAANCEKYAKSSHDNTAHAKTSITGVNITCEIAPVTESCGNTKMSACIPSSYYPITKPTSPAFMTDDCHETHKGLIPLNADGHGGSFGIKDYYVCDLCRTPENEVFYTDCESERQEGTKPSLEVLGTSFIMQTADETTRASLSSPENPLVELQHILEDGRSLDDRRVTAAVAMSLAVELGLTTATACEQYIVSQLEYEPDQPVDNHTLITASDEKEEEEEDDDDDDDNVVVIIDTDGDNPTTIRDAIPAADQVTILPDDSITTLANDKPDIYQTCTSNAMGKPRSDGYAETDSKDQNHEQLQMPVVPSSTELGSWNNIPASVAQSMGYPLAMEQISLDDADHGRTHTLFPSTAGKPDHGQETYIEDPEYSDVSRDQQVLATDHVVPSGYHDNRLQPAAAAVTSVANNSNTDPSSLDRCNAAPVDAGTMTSQSMTSSSRGDGDQAVEESTVDNVLSDELLYTVNQSPPSRPRFAILCCLSVGLSVIT